ncbi:unnamed protein product [Onchocerca ochengi]|uniref:NB-ARC domain-containing protein n=1 Tax=Onchocerca ochengi TaxID=42157 RepID=A0A182EBW5_ONCOC|nr:unnamed protein product [Onchocerca ochengi]
MLIVQCSNNWETLTDFQKLTGSEDMHLVIEKYRNLVNTTQPSEPILVPFMRYSRECIVSAIMEFINYNFIMDSPPKYRDSEGDMVLLETREAFEAAVDDVMQTPMKLFIVHVDGFYKSELPKEQDIEIPMTVKIAPVGNIDIEGADFVEKADVERIVRVEDTSIEKLIALKLTILNGLILLKTAWLMTDFEKTLQRLLALKTPSDMMKRIKQEVSKQIVRHPIISKLAGLMNELEKQKAYLYKVCYNEQKSTQTFQANIYDEATVASSSSTSLENQSSSKILLGKDDTVVFQLVDESPVWDVKAIYERKTIPLTKWENPSSSDLLKTAREGEGIFSKRWVLRRFACRRWENVSIINETMSDMLEIHRSKMTVTNLPEKGQIVDFTVWVKCLASTGYFCATWRLHKMIDNGRDSIPEGPSLMFEIFVNPFIDENFTLERPLFTNDTQELEELASSGSVSASDYEVIDGGETMSDSEKQ